MAPVSVSYLICLHNDNFICKIPYTIFMCVAGCEQTRIYRVSLYFDSVWNNKHEFETSSGDVHSRQHYVNKFVSDLWQIGGFLRVFTFPPPIKLTPTI
jgi:hypothetical protein